MTVTPSTAEPTRSQAYVDDRAHVFHSWSAQAALDPLVVAGAEGSRFWDDQGNRYLDFASQLVNVNIGHQHPKLVAAIKEQADVLCTVAPIHANAARSEAARLIAELAPGDLDMVFFTNGGAEATENAMRMARLHTGRHKVLTTYRSYHGGDGRGDHDDRRSAALGQRAGRRRAWSSSGGRTPTARRSTPTDDAEECERALAHLADVLMVEGAQNVAAIVLETVVGTNGILVPPDGYLQGVRDLCDRARHRDDRRRGDGRLRSLRRVVRRRPLGRHPRPHLLRQGRQLGLRAARRRDHQPTHRRHVRRPRRTRAA